MNRIIYIWEKIEKYVKNVIQRKIVGHTEEDIHNLASVIAEQTIPLLVHYKIMCRDICAYPAHYGSIRDWIDDIDDTIDALEIIKDTTVYELPYRQECDVREKLLKFSKILPDLFL
jgi:hypothetical protein